MKQLVVISGKGGTGKTVLAGAFSAIAKNHVMADCDVDASNLHLLLNPIIKERHFFKSGFTALIDPLKCTHCLNCIQACRFDAISNSLVVDSISCEGCGFCYHLCSAQAIQMTENNSGEWFISDTRFGPFVHAKLGVAEENSGKLVSLVKKQAWKLASNKNNDLIIIDGAPGIGCPVIACISNTDCAVVVTEPTLSGLHDAKRVIEVAQHFDVPVKLVINKFNLNESMVKSIEQYAKDNHIFVIGKIPFDQAVVESVVNGKTIMEMSDSVDLQNIIKDIWGRLCFT